MGWNSWDCYGTTVTEAEVLANAEFMNQRMLASGWDTVVVDICWYDPAAKAHGYNDGTTTLVDAFGRPVPAPNRFPSARDGQGFTPLAQRVHELGLRFGVHLLRGIPRVAVERALPVEGTNWTARDIADTTSTCPWNSDNYGLDHDHPGAQAYYDSLAAQLARWGVDFVKADDMLAPYHSREITALSQALARTGRPILLSLSPGNRLSTAHLDHLRQHADTWRISGDLWDRWDDVHAQFARMARWAPLQRPGAWADADMLPLGRIGIRAELGEDRSSRLTPEEQRSLITLWVMARSPLMVGGDLPSSDAGTVDDLTRADVLAVLREGTGGAELLREPGATGSRADGEVIVWSSGRSGVVGQYVAVFWTGEHPEDVELALVSVGASNKSAVTDLWTGHRLQTESGYLHLSVPRHGVRLLQLTPEN